MTTPDTMQLGLGFGDVRRQRRTWRVAQLVQEARDLVEQELGDVWVEGEISNLRPASSGHIYFTLKDAEAQLPVVLFRRQAMLLRFRPEDGLAVRVRGKVTVYEQRGQLQLVADVLEPVGAGSLQLAFEQLRERLKLEGLFDADHKKPLPLFPSTVVIVTSSTGAVIRDFLNIVGRRHARLNVLLLPVAVQGESAAAELEAALDLANEHALGDVIVIARGGGSLEDLAAFNSETVARAIARSHIPVVSAVGHETDVTIADFVADLRAPTPSAAAELITEAQHKIEEQLGELRRRLDRAARYQLLQRRQQYLRLPTSRAEQKMMAGIHRRQQYIDDLTFRAETAASALLRRAGDQSIHAHQALLACDPRRRFAVARDTLQSSDIRLEHAMERILSASFHRCDSTELWLTRSMDAQLKRVRNTADTVALQLKALSPLAVLERGYAIVQDAHGSLIRSSAAVKPGQRFTTRVADGSFTSTVDAPTANKGKSGSANRPAHEQ